MIRRFVFWLVEGHRWPGTAAGCGECGTGGPYDVTGRPQHTRYLYDGVTSGLRDGRPTWSACSVHPLRGLAPLVDYGRDRVVTIRQTRRDAARAHAQLRAEGWR